MNALQYEHESLDDYDLDDMADILLRLTFAAQNYERLLKVLYSYDIFDRAKLQSIINDLAMDLSVDVPTEELTITRKKTENSASSMY